MRGARRLVLVSLCSFCRCKWVDTRSPCFVLLDYVWRRVVGMSGFVWCFEKRRFCRIHFIVVVVIWDRTFSVYWSAFMIVYGYLRIKFGKIAGGEYDAVIALRLTGVLIAACVEWPTEFTPCLLSGWFQWRMLTRIETCRVIGRRGSRDHDDSSCVCVCAIVQRVRPLPRGPAQPAVKSVHPFPSPHGHCAEPLLQSSNPLEDVARRGSKRGTITITITVNLLTVGQTLQPKRNKDGMLKSWAWINTVYTDEHSKVSK